MLDERESLVAVDAESGADGLLVVISAATGQHALDDDVLGNLEVDNSVELDALLLEQLGQNASLLHGAWEAVQQEAVCSVVLVKAIFNHARGDVGRNELAGINVGLCLNAQRGALTNVGAEQVTGGDVRNRQLLAQDCCLGAFAGTGRAEEYVTHYLRSPS